MKRTLYPKKLTSLHLTFAALFLLIAGFTSCKKKAEVTGTSYIQFVNASEEASPLDFYVDNNKINSTALSYKQNTSYFSVSSTDHPAIIKTSATGAAVVSFNLSPQPGIYYSIYYFGGLTAAYQDDLTAPQTGKARVRFINLNQGVPGNVDLGITGGAKLVTALIAAVNSTYLDVAPGASFSVYNAGTTTSLLDIPTSIEAGHIYTVFLSGVSLTTIAGTVVLQK
jgi:hypothetical protein